MIHLIFIKSIFFGLLLSTLTQATAQNNTPDYYKCVNRVGGEWNYGRAPQACDGQTFGDDRVILQDYAPIIFNDFENISRERSRYMNELNAIIKAASIYYLKKRIPGVSQQELEAWTLGILTTASQESYWSHYRQATDQKLKMMRGDFGHGHGMMQVDDRAHFNAIERGIGWSFAANITYAMDIYYAAWVRTPTQSCVNSSTNYIARIRSAWSAYNGGPSRICRWQNPNDKWAKNDKNFFNQLSNKNWQNFVKENNKAPSINIACLMENGTNCTGTTLPPHETPELKFHQLYLVQNQKACVLGTDGLQCVEDQKDRVCLLALSAFNTENSLPLSEETYQDSNPTVWDRHQLCKQKDSTLFSVGQNIQLQKNINLRTSVGSGVVATLPAKSVVSILDFELRNPRTLERYYKVRYQNKTGYLYAGTRSDFNSWATLSTFSSPPLTNVAQNNQKIRINLKSGINMRSSPTGRIITAIPKNVILTVENVITAGVDNNIYYQVTYQGKTGTIYSGKLKPLDTVKSWTEVLN